MKKIIYVFILCGLLFISCNEEKIIDNKINETKESVNNERINSIKVKSLDASLITKYGIKMDSSFKLKLLDEVDFDYIKNNILITPEVDFTLEKIDDKTYIIEPKTMLLENTVYVISTRDKKFKKAFQTEEELLVKKIEPNKKSKKAAVDDVISIYFNGEVSDIKEEFEIYPPVEGKFEYKKNKVVFIPRKLLENKEYTITLKKGITDGIRTMKEDYVSTFQTESFDSELKIDYRVSTMLPNTEEYILVNEYSKELDYKVDIYNVKSFNDFRTAKLKFESSYEEINTEEFDNVYSENTVGRSYKNREYIKIPSLDRGMYIARIASDEEILYLFLNVNQNIYYFAETDDTYLLWVINNATRKLVQGAKLFLREEELSETNENGLLVVEKNKLGSDLYFSDKSGKYLIERNDVKKMRSIKDYSMNYWAFIYTDKSVYHLADEVNIFGYVKNYNARPVEDVRLVLSDEKGNDYISKLITVNEELTFTDKIALNHLKEGEYLLTLYDKESKKISSMPIKIEEYNQSEICLNTLTDKKSMFMEDTLFYTVQSSYFNHLPYENLDFKVYGIKEDEIINGKTDKNGIATLEYQYQEKNSLEEDSWKPKQVYFDLTAYGPQKTFLNKKDYISVFTRDMMILTDMKEENGYITVDIETAAIDLEKSNEFISPDYHNIKGAPLDVEYEVLITDNYYIKTYKDTALDLRVNRKRDIYTYTNKKSLLTPIKGATADGKSSFQFKKEDGHTYDIKIISSDTKGRKVVSMLHYFLPKYDKEEEYHLKLNNQNAYKIGDKVKYSILKNGEEISNDEADDFVLELKCRNGILEYDVVENSSHSFEFFKKYRPNILLKTIYYDGNALTILPKSGSELIAYDYKELEYFIESNVDKRVYKPGEDVVLDIHITKEGKPFNGVVNISLVDENYFSIMDDFSMEDLHSYIEDAGIRYESIASLRRNKREISERSEKMMSNVGRNYCTGVVLFKTVDVKDGRAKVSFKAPNEINNYKVTLHAINKNLEYGSDKFLLKTDIPLSIRNISDKKYIKGDDIFLTVRAEGDVSDITYRLDYNKKAVEETLNKNQTVFMKMGELLEDEDYIITVNTKDQTNSIKGGAELLDHMVEFYHIEEVDFNKKYQPKYMDRKTSLILYNKKVEEYLIILHEFIGNAIKIEDKIARNEVFKILNDIMISDTCENELSTYQCDDGGIALLPTDTAGSVDVTSLILASGYINGFDKEKLIGFLENKLASKEESLMSRAKILWALSKEQQPVLVDIDNLINENELNANIKLYLALSMANLEDETRAKNYYDAVYKVKEKLGDKETLLLGVLAKKLKIEDELYKIDYAHRASLDESLSIEKLLYLQSLDFKMSPATCTYYLDGKKNVVEIVDKEPTRIEIDHDDFKILKLEGDVIAYEKRVIYGTDDKEYLPTFISLDRMCDESAVYKKPYEVLYHYKKFGNPSSIHIKIPSGFEFLSTTTSNQYRVDDENKEIIVYLDSTIEEEGKFKVRFLPCQKGRYTFESDYIRSCASSPCMTERMSIEVKGE